MGSAFFEFITRLMACKWLDNAVLETINFIYFFLEFLFFYLKFCLKNASIIREGLVFYKVSKRLREYKKTMRKNSNHWFC